MQLLPSHRRIARCDDSMVRQVSQRHDRNQQRRTGGSSRSWLAGIAGLNADQPEGQARVRALCGDPAAGGRCGVCDRVGSNAPPAAVDAADKLHWLGYNHDNGTTKSVRATAGAR